MILCPHCRESHEGECPARIKKPSRRSFLFLGLFAGASVAAAPSAILNGFTESINDGVNLATFNEVTRKFAQEFADNFFVDTPMMTLLRKSGPVAIDGGRFIQTPFTYDNKEPWDAFDIT